jgi:hypothetical protein
MYMGTWLAVRPSDNSNWYETERYVILSSDKLDYSDNQTASQSPHIERDEPESP